MFSMPPATATLMLPNEISCAAETMACAPEPQTRLTVSAGIVTGSPAWTAACRAGFIFVPAWTTLPMTTLSTSSGRSFARTTAAPIATEPRVGAGTSLSEPPKVPIAVRTGSAKTTERCDVMARLLSVSGWCVSDLREAAVDEQFCSGDVACVVGGEENHGFGDLFGCTKPSERHRIGDHFPALCADFRRGQKIVEARCVGGARAYRVHADTARLQVCRPGPRERAHGCFCSRVHAVRGQSLARHDGGIQDDRGAIRHQRKRLLDREQDAFHVDVEHRIANVFGYRAHRRISRNTGVGEHDIELAFLPLDLSKEAIEIARVRHITLYAGHITCDLFHCSCELRIAASGDEDVGAFIDELLRRREADTAGPACH